MILWNFCAIDKFWHFWKMFYPRPSLHQQHSQPAKPAVTPCELWPQDVRKMYVSSFNKAYICIYITSTIYGTWSHTYYTCMLSSPSFPPPSPPPHTPPFPQMLHSKECLWESAATPEGVAQQNKCHPQIKYSHTEPKQWNKLWVQNWWRKYDFLHVEKNIVIVLSHNYRMLMY